MKKRLSPKALKRLQDEAETCRAMGDGLLKWYMDEVKKDGHGN